MIPGPCWRCELPGHPAAECQPPPAATRQELQARIDRYAARWQDGQITTGQKRLWIEMERKAYEKARGK